jgi:hypothetical protein
MADSSRDFRFSVPTRSIKSHARKRAARHPDIDFTVAVTGRLVHAATGHPLQGLEVTAHIEVRAPRAASTRAPAAAPPVRETLAGRGRSRFDGRFEIPILYESGVRDNLQTVSQTPAVNLVLQVLRPDSVEFYIESEPVALDAADPVTLLVPLPKRELQAADWARVAAAMEGAGIQRVADLMRQLVGVPAETSAFADWSLEERHNIAWALEESFFDPGGLLRRRTALPTYRAVHVDRADRQFFRAIAEAETVGDEAIDRAAADAYALMTSFSSMLQVDWPVELEALRAGDPGRALASARPPSGFAVSEALAQGDLQQLVPAHRRHPDLIGYRDYLRTIVVGAPSLEGYGARIAKLETRFHQNFRTGDASPQPANAVLIPIVRQIVRAATGAGYGFGVEISGIEAQGDRTDREYLDYLIGLTGTSRRTLELRYRLDLDRADAVESSPVQENIATLRGFLRDGFQSVADPYDPIIPAELLGTAPFYLQFDEWHALQGPFFPENHFPMKETFWSGVRADFREEVLMQLTDNDWFVHLLDAETALYAAHEDLRHGQMEAARAGYLEAQSQAWLALQKAPDSRAAKDAGMEHWTVAAVTAPLVDQIQILDVSTPEALDALLWTVSLRYGYIPPVNPNPPSSKLFPAWLAKTYPAHILALERLVLFIAPACSGELASLVGEHASAVDLFAETTRFLVAGAGLEDQPGWVQYTGYSTTYEYFLTLGVASGTPPQNQPKYWIAYRGGQLPYTADTAGDSDPIAQYPAAGQWQSLAAELSPVLAHPVERRYLELRHADAILAWADALYRTDEPASIQRARELYKAVLLLHGIKPAVSPSWPKPSSTFLERWTSAMAAIPVVETTRRRTTLQIGRTVMESGVGGQIQTPILGQTIVASKSLPEYAAMLPAQNNPARVAQIQHASRCFLQIEAGLNIYGLRDEHIPVLRYRPLKEAADRFAADARLAQTDLVAYVGKVEDALQDKLLHAHMLEKAGLQAAIAGEQIELAKHRLALAERQVYLIEQEIEATRKQIEEEKEFFNQVVTFIGGMVDAIGKLPDDLTKTGGSGGAAAAGFGTYEAAGSLSWMGAGAGAMAGYGILVYAGTSSMMAMEEQFKSLAQKLDHLRDVALALAKGEVRARQREVRITNLQQQIALSDAAFAQQLVDFAAIRFLDLDFWSQMAALARRLLRRYLELGTAHAWQAERALAYEQDRVIDIIRLDYFPDATVGIGGADRLKADLAELEANRLAGVQHTIPITRVVSLAFDFPLQFARLKQTGSCTFATSDVPYMLAHPGTYAHRIRAVTARVLTVDGVAQPQGLLSNPGLSSMRRRDGSHRLSLRAAEALPVSGFRIRRDLDLFGLPGEMLMTFEGHAVETFWTLELPVVANPQGLDGLLDVELVFDVQAQYSPALHAQDLEDRPTSVHRARLVSGAVTDAAALQALQESSGGPVTITFDLTTLLPKVESQRQVVNVMVMVAGPDESTGSATLECDVPALSVAFTFENGVAFSNGPPLDTADEPAGALNAFIGIDAGQTFRVILNPGTFQSLDPAAIRDVLFGIEYTAEA